MRDPVTAELEAERDKCRDLLRQCWDAAGLLDAQVTGQPWQHYDLDCVRCDLIPQIENLAQKASNWDEDQEVMSCGHALACRVDVDPEQRAYCAWCREVYTYRTLAEYVEQERDEARARVAELESLSHSLAERVAAQSELLEQRAEGVGRSPRRGGLER